MAVGQGDAGVDELAGGQDGARLLGGRLERQLRERRVGGVRREGDVVGVGAAVVDLADYEVALGGDVLGFWGLVLGGWFGGEEDEDGGRWDVGKGE